MMIMNWHEDKNHGLRAEKIIIRAKAIDSPSTFGTSPPQVQTIAREQAQAWIDEPYKRGKQLRHLARHPTYTGSR